MADLGSQAVVLGAGMAGLLSARVLSEFYGSVTVVERDALPDHPDQRKGVPQGRHLHNFLSRGTQVIGELFPGLLDELVAAGAVVVNDGTLSGIYVRIGRYEMNRTGRLADPEPLAAYQASRPFMECHIRRRVAALANVMILDNHEVVEPVIAAGVVTGARIINGDTGMETVLDADLVVDATGRAARTPAFLDSHGFGPPPEKRTATTWGYSSQLMRIPQGRVTERMVFVNQGSRAPGALLVAYERNTWMLAIARPVNCGSPPMDFAESLAAAAEILPATIMAGLRDATPIGDIAIARSTAAVWSRYDRMPRLPGGLLVIGDALCHLNPIYGQGMTMAALQALALRDCLRAGDADLARRFYSAATADIGPVWAMNAANDRILSPTASRPLHRRLRSWSERAALKAAANDIAVAERFLRIRSLIDPPTRLQDPALLLRILLANLRHPRSTPGVVADDLPHSASVNRADEVAIRALIDRQVKGLGHRGSRGLCQRVHARRGLRDIPGKPPQGPRSDRIVLRTAVQETPTRISPANTDHPPALSDA
jgi:2-polyprenyl-6-methoxyphenol hydroxylase-like FAD-dependent oxidoreductase